MTSISRTCLLAGTFVGVFFAGGPALGQESEQAVQLPLDTLPFIGPFTLPSGPAPAESTDDFVGFEPLSSISPGVDVNVSNLANNESEVSIDINPTNPNNLVIVGHAPDFATMNTFFSLDGGQTWTLVALGAADDGLSSSFRFDPTLTFDDDGNVYVGYGVGVGASTAIVVARSTDGGQNYTQFTTVATTANIGGTPGNDKWHLAAGPDPVVPSQQNIYIAWTQNVTEAAGLDQRIVLAASTNGGATFSAPPVILNDPSVVGTRLANLFADPAVGPNGEVYVAWHDIGAGQVFVDVSFDGGNTFGVDSLVTTSGTGFKTSIPAQPDRGVFVGPTIDTDRSGGRFNGRLYVTYTDLGPGGLPDIDVFVRFSDTTGTVWSPRTRVNDDVGNNSQFLPWLDIDQSSGLVNVVWYDARNDPNNRMVEIFNATSTDGGVTFEPNLLVSDGRSDQSLNNANRTTNNYLEYIGIAALNCEASSVWADNSTDLADLDYFSDRVSATLCPLVPFDIRPQSCRNPLSRVRGVLPAAILGTADFDVNEIDVATVELEGVPPLRSSFEDVATPFKPFVGKQDPFDCTDEGPDGFLDLVMQFDNLAVVEALGPVSRGDVLILQVTGELLDGLPIRGEDVVVVIQ